MFAAGKPQVQPSARSVVSHCFRAYLLFYCSLGVWAPLVLLFGLICLHKMWLSGYPLITLAYEGGRGVKQIITFAKKGEGVQWNAYRVSCYQLNNLGKTGCLSSPFFSLLLIHPLLSLLVVTDISWFPHNIGAPFFTLFLSSFSLLSHIFFYFFLPLPFPIFVTTFSSISLIYYVAWSPTALVCILHSVFCLILSSLGFCFSSLVLPYHLFSLQFYCVIPFPQFHLEINLFLWEIFSWVQIFLGSNLRGPNFWRQNSLW